MRLLVKNIGKIVGIETAGRLRLCGGEMDRLETLDDAWLLADDGRIAAFGRMETLGEMAADRTVDAEGGMLFPSFCDSHTHLVYAGSREQEFLDKINGLSYEEIARRGGGILNSADLLHETSEEELYAQAMERVREIAAKGTGCVASSAASARRLRWPCAPRSSARMPYLGAISAGRRSTWSWSATKCFRPWRPGNWPISSMSSATKGSLPWNRRPAS